jgi:hypothetical protein
VIVPGQQAGGTAVTGLRARIKTNRPARAALFLAQNVLHGVRSTATSHRLSPGSPDERTHDLVAMVRVKDEARFLPEWLAHHVGLGVEHCYIYDNNSSDDIAAVMAPFVDRGLATIAAWPAVPASPGSHIDFLRRFGHTASWVAFLDADEFIVESRPGELRRVLATHGKHPAVALSSRYFGSAGHETIPTGLVTERFDRANAEISDHVKVIARPAAIHGYRNTHNFYYRYGRLARTPDGRRVFGSFVRAAPEPALVVHHYVYRSREDYEAKLTRGYSTASGAKAQVRRASRAETEFHRHNDVRQPVPEAATQATAQLLDELGYPPELYLSPAADQVG